MNYSWETFGDDSKPVIALIAPSNGIGREEIEQRIIPLTNKGFCVKVALYTDGNIVVESDVEGRVQSDRMGTTFFPATSSGTGANQIIDCIKNGWNIMPLMGGDSFQDKIPLIIHYFEEHPEEKNIDVKMFGMSNSTYATILANRNICSFTSTPFTSVFMVEEMHPNFNESSKKLEMVLK